MSVITLIGKKKCYFDHLTTLFLILARASIGSKRLPTKEKQCKNKEIFWFPIQPRVNTSLEGQTERIGC